MMFTHLWVPPICHIDFHLAKSSRFHEASTRFHHFFTAQGLLRLIGFRCQSFDMNSIGGWSTSWTSYWVLPPASWCPIQTAVTTDSSAETSFTKRDPFWKLLSWAISLYCVWHGEQLVLILVALMIGACSSMTLMVQALKRRMRCESWSRKWEHNMSQE